MINDDPRISAKVAAQVRKHWFRQVTHPKTAEDHQSVADGKRKQQLLFILSLLSYAEAEIAELNLETSAVLLEAAIADIFQHLE
ncbi:hypothetical protein [Bradyrhizobium sp. DASA03007]|uniref:hypothetical protein n=1 Tax=unclassified Bradyrhizobium TaxID=2631580 RepID=UPI003F70819F